MTYNEKHNEANLEESRDGHNENRSWNCSVEGETDDPAINQLRERQKRNFIATMMLSQGVPMIVGGDEIGRTQAGNNNAYCQDNALSWLDWNLTPQKKLLLEFTQRMIRLRHEHPTFHREHFFHGDPIRDSDVKDVVWMKPEGGEMTETEWNQSFMRSLGVYFPGEGLAEKDNRGRPLGDANYLVLFNAHHDEIPFQLPACVPESRWLVVMDTSHDDGLTRGQAIDAGQPYPLQGRSLALLQQQKVGE